MSLHYDWDLYHREEAYRMKYPDENVVRFLAANFPAEGRKDLAILDFGCGAGRHVALVAREGFRAYGVDGSATALARTREVLAREGLHAELAQAPLTALPFEDDTFHGVIEVSVLIHNPPKDVLRMVGEVYRVLRRGGRAFFLLLTTEDFLYGRGPEVEPNTFLIDETDWVSRVASERRPPLLYHLFDREEVDRLMAQFAHCRVESLRTTFHSLAITGPPRQKSYWVVVAEK